MDITLITGNDRWGNVSLKDREQYAGKGQRPAQWWPPVWGGLLLRVVKLHIHNLSSFSRALPLDFVVGDRV